MVIDPETLKLLAVVEAEAYGRPETSMRISCFIGPATGQPTPLDEIEVLDYIGASERSACAPAVRTVIDLLCDRRLVG